MGKMKDLQIFIAEEICKENPLVDLDKAFVIANEIWDNAMIKKDITAKHQLNKYVRKWMDRTVRA